MQPELRRARAAVSVVFGVCGAAFATWAARVPAAQHRLGLAPGPLAIGLFGLAAGSLVALACSGALITRIGSRAAALAGSAVLCLGLPLVSLARVERAYGRPIFAGFHAFWNIGGLAGSGLAATAAAAHVPITAEFPVSGAALLAVSSWAISSRFLRGPDESQGPDAPGLAVPSRALLALGAIAFCALIAEGTVNHWSAVYLSSSAAAPPAVASLGYFAFSVAMIAVRLVADRLATRIGAVRLTRVAAMTAKTGFALVIAVPDPAAGIAGFGIIGLGVSAIVPLAWSAAARQQPGSPGRAIAGVVTLGYLGFLLGPVTIGGLAGLAGLRIALAAAAAVTLGVYVLAPALRAPSHPAPAEPVTG